MPEPTAIIFGGTSNIPSPEVFEEARKNNPVWFQLLAQAYEKFQKRPENKGVYADPKGGGASLDQVWLSFSLLGTSPHCLLARPYPAGLMSRIPRVIEVTAGELVEVLKDIQAKAGSIHTTTLHYDGKTGHCIVLKSYDQEADRFLYHDPWPAESLLCRENNLVGVDAKAEGKHWSVTAKELESVVFAAFVLPHLWARHEGIEFDALLDDWKEGEFFKFFHLKLINERSEQEMHRHMFVPGPFKDSISIIVDWKDGGKIVKASLIMRKAWMAENMLLALDVSKSFILDLAPKPDREVYRDISDELWKASDPGFGTAIMNTDPNESLAAQCVHTFMGSLPESTVVTDFGSLSLENLASGDLKIEYMLV